MARPLLSDLKVALLMGGDSDEREISLLSGREVKKALAGRCRRLTVFDPKKDLVRLTKAAVHGDFDVAFLALHGPGGEDGKIQGLLDLAGLPYTGSSTAACALAMDKAMSKRVFHQQEIPTPRWCVVTEEAFHGLPWKQLEKRILHRVGKKIVVKPLSSGSSVGVMVLPKRGEWKTAVKQALRYGQQCLVEAFVEGREFTVAVLEREGKAETLPVIEIRTKRAFFDYKAKYTAGASEEICPAPLSPKQSRQAQALGLAAHKALVCRQYSRTDMMLGKTGWRVLETNVLPGLTAGSLFPKASVTAGIPFAKLIEHLVLDAYRYGHRT